MRYAGPPLAIATLIVLAALGCGRIRGHSWGGGSYAFSSSGPGKTLVSRVVEYLTYDGRVVLVLAAAGCSTASSGAGPTSTGEMETREGRKIGWSCASPDGMRGTVSIDGKPFELTKGAVFLIWPEGEQIRIEQVAVDMSRLQGGDLQEKLQALGASEPKIAEFLRATGGSPR
jgi:hypothetical protein